MEANTEAEMLEDMAKRFCPNCGAAVTPNDKGRPRIFCSEPCRYAWKNRNPHPENWKSTGRLSARSAENHFWQAGNMGE